MNVKQSSKDDNIVINTLSDFIQNIEKLPKCLEGYDRFYRGQNIDLPLIPAVFRSDSLAKNESNIFHEIVNKKPEEFEKCKCTFDYLVKMQHYNIPTRLLDITSNPLVALFFACFNCGENATPTVYCIDIPNSRIKNYTSDSVTILSALARSGDTVQNQILEIVENYKNGELETILEAMYSALKLYFKPTENKEVADTKTFIKEMFDRFDIPRSAELDTNGVLYFNNLSINIESLLGGFASFYNKILRESNAIDKAWKYALLHERIIVNDGYLLHEIKQDKAYFQDIMDIRTFDWVYCTNPKLDNPRLIRQSGAFLIYPHKDKTLDSESSTCIKTSRVSIDKSCVGTILESLELLNISEEYLYADMDTVSKAIKEKYSKKD